MNAAIIIKKYPNRRLYDTSASRYINLEDIAGFVRDGKDVQVVDAQTGEDLTRVTLTQVIMDDAKQQPTGLPLELLRQLIVSSDRMGREFIMWYLKSAFDAYKTVQSKLHTGINEVQAAALSPIGMMKSFLQGQGEKQALPTQTVQSFSNCASASPNWKHTWRNRFVPRGLPGAKLQESGADSAALEAEFIERSHKSSGLHRPMRSHRPVE